MSLSGHGACLRWESGDGIHAGGFSWPQSFYNFQPVSAESFGSLYFGPETLLWLFRSPLVIQLLAFYK